MDLKKAINGTLGTSRLTEVVNAPEKLPALTFTFVMSPSLAGKSIVVLGRDDTAAQRRQATKTGRETIVLTLP